MPQSSKGIAAAFTDAGLKAHIAATPQLSQHFPGDIDELSVTEVGDGNLNFVFFVRGGGGALAIKQALPFSRMSKGARTLTRDRLGFEAQALRLFAEFAPDFVPRVHHYDAERGLMAQAFLSPHVVLRRGLMDGMDYPLLADHMSTFLANCLYGTSALGMEPARRRPLIASFAANTELCEITERLVFTEPFRPSPNNRWTSPQLDADVAALQGNARLQMRVRDLKHRFLTRTDALLHGDLHSGSIMLTPDSTQVIDPEFATFGPMGFDIGMLLGNLMLGHLAQPGHAQGGARPAPAILRTAEGIWKGFAAKFRTLALSGSGLLAAADDAPAPAFDRARQEWVDTLLDEVLQDTIGFAAVEMIRRTIGAAHVQDLDGIADADLRASCERAVLDHAAGLLSRAERADSIRTLTDI